MVQCGFSYNFLSSAVCECRKVCLGGEFEHSGAQLYMIQNLVCNVRLVETGGLAHDLEIRA